MAMHNNSNKRMYSPVPYTILQSGDYTATSGPLQPGSTVFKKQSGWRTSRGMLDMPAYNKAVQAFTPSACLPESRYIDDNWVKYHAKDADVEAHYKKTQATSRRLVNKGAGLKRADIDKLRAP